MKAEWSKAWNGSKQPRKQRKYRFNAPLHIKQKLMHVHLSPELRTKYGRRQILVSKGDKVIVMRGQHSKKTGEISKIRLKMEKINIQGIDNIKKDGSTSPIGFKASNLMIINLNLVDKVRKAKLKVEDKAKKTKVEDKVKKTKVEVKKEKK
ncbi:50S ribosomal protein L24 [archaeon]|jgi:large subunit ribosomal protein L24|nr:50S ribosomal protein L24 [archaeon]MBT3730915.1 50S ribosomal protein L24 [archaeon]MBT4669846.1 50S ribosomal protein L24 [archaeon]MBT5029998.1 50S ribosomal protein L24 [archaeon]MBT5288099.1 50S ribosomal protein L24 [archaeon]